MSKPKLLILFLIIFLLGDSTYSFLQYYYIPLDGDISTGVVPSNEVQQVLNDPFGFNLLSSGEEHVNPNRFFGHFFFKEYMEKVPIWLQSFFDPITSVYLSCALMKISIHLLVIFILATLISGTRNLLDKKFLICAALIVPFIQANGYIEHMGINDKAITYTFFYALPVVLQMLFFMPFYRMVFENEFVRLGLLKYIFLLSLSIILPLTGPLNPGIILIVSGLIGIHYLINFDRPSISFSTRSLLASFRKIPTTIYIFLVPVCLVSLYSLFLGRFDSNYSTETIAIADRYMKLPLGIYYLISQSLGLPLLFIIICTNVYMIQKQFTSPEAQKVTGTLKWIGLFAAVYILLLPLGGYRTYRPNILRYDTFMPVTIALLYFYGISTFFLLNNLKLRLRKIYMTGLFVFFSIYMNSDRLRTDEYHNERKALEFLANSPDEVTVLPTKCKVMSWEIFSQPSQSEYNAILLKYWNITKDKKLYYQVSTPSD